jgi:HAAS domain-containing protein
VTLSETGQSRVNGYVFVLERSLVAVLPRDVARDAVREIDSHLRDRIAATAATPDERAALEKILSELGPPQRVAQAYSVERTVDEAVITGKLFAIVRAVWHVAMSGISGFLAALGVFIGYAIAAAFLILGIMKPVFPGNIGFWVNDDGPLYGFDLSWRMGVGPGVRHEHLAGGYWVVPICLVVGFGLLFLTHRGARKFLKWWRTRHAGFIVTVRPAL